MICDQERKMQGKRNRPRNERDHGKSRQELIKSHYKYSDPLNDKGLEVLTTCTARILQRSFDFPKT